MGGSWSGVQLARPKGRSAECRRDGLAYPGGVQASFVRTAARRTAWEVGGKHGREQR